MSQSIRNDLELFIDFYPPYTYCNLKKICFLGSIANLELK